MLMMELPAAPAPEIVKWPADHYLNQRGLGDLTNNLKQIQL